MYASSGHPCIDLTDFRDARFADRAGAGASDQAVCPAPKSSTFMVDADDGDDSSLEGEPDLMGTDTDSDGEPLRDVLSRTRCAEYDRINSDNEDSSGDESDEEISGHGWQAVRNQIGRRRLRRQDPKMVMIANENWKINSLMRASLWKNSPVVG